MKYRDYKGYHPGGIFHLFNRGNNKQDVFLGPEDYSYFFYRLGVLLGIVPFTAPNKKRKYFPKIFPKDAFTILGYCLLPNHFHLLIRQNTDISIAQLTLQLGSAYGKYFNRKYKRLGSVFQDQPKAKEVYDDTYFLEVLAYIHNNPYENKNEYPYSSLQEYLGKPNFKLCDTQLALSMHGNIQQLLDYTEDQQNRPSHGLK